MVLPWVKQVQSLSSETQPSSAQPPVSLPVAPKQVYRVHTKNSKSVKPVIQAQYPNEIHHTVSKPPSQ